MVQKINQKETYNSNLRNSPQVMQNTHTPRVPEREMGGVTLGETVHDMALIPPVHTHRIQLSHQDKTFLSYKFIEKYTT
jgi:hypothetical protein